MGLKERLIKIKQQLMQSTKKTEISVPRSRTDTYNFVLELFSDMNLNTQVETILISLISKFNVNNILIHLLDEDENVYKLIGHKGITKETADTFEFDYDSYFLKALNHPLAISDLMNEPAFNNEINRFLPYNLK